MSVIPKELCRKPKRVFLKLAQQRKFCMSLGSHQIAPKGCLRCSIQKTRSSTSSKTSDGFQGKPKDKEISTGIGNSKGNSAHPNDVLSFLVIDVHCSSCQNEWMHFTHRFLPYLPLCWMQRLVIHIWAQKETIYIPTCTKYSFP